MTDSMKFGPEWIRTLSETGPLGLGSHPSNSSHGTSPSSISQMSLGSHPPSSGSSGPPPPASSMRYTLAEHRYGREEMLALYSSSLNPPDNLKNLTGLYVEKSQQPLALFSFTEDELRIWNRGVNPDGLGRGGANKGQTEGSVRGRRDGTGREGRGRGRGGGSPGTYFPRPPGSNNISYPPVDINEPPGQEISQGPIPFNRNRPPFERQGGERSWSERNGGGDGGGGRGRMGGDTNWRRHRAGEEESPNDPNMPPNNSPGWKPQARWQHPGRSWRDEDSWTDRDPRMSNHHLPEWAMEKNEGGGSFDASGAFHGHEMDDEMPVKRRERSYHDQKSKSESSDIGDTGGGSDGGSTDRMHELSDKESSHSMQPDQDRPERKRDQEESAPHFGLDEIKKHVEKRLKGDEQALELSEIKRQLELLERQQQQVAKQNQVAGDNINPQDLINQVGPNQPVAEGVQVQSNSQQQVVNQQVGNLPPPQQAQQVQMQVQPQVPLPVQSQQSQASSQALLSQQPPNIQQSASGVLLGQVPPQVGGNQPVIIAQQSPGGIQVQMNQQQPPIMNPQISPIQPQQSPQQVHQPLNTLARLHQPPPQSILHDSHIDDHSINDNIATDLVAKLMEEEEKRDKQWYYKDPQGQVQGPFSCGEMAEWFQSGYFTIGLMVKRACDPSFSPLGELIKVWGCIPFLAEQGGAGAANAQAVIAQQVQAEKEHQAAQVQAQAQAQQSQVNPQIQDVMMHQFKMEHFRQQQQQHQQQQQQQQQLILRQQQAAIANRNPVKMATTEWPDHLPQQESQGGGQQASLQLRALLAQMQAHQQSKQQQQTSKLKENAGGGGGGGGAVMETLLSLHQQQVAQQAALQQALQAAHLAEVGGSAGGAGAIRSLVSQMQQGKLRLNNQPANVDSVWNGGSSWKQWSHVNPKSFKTEQQVLEEQMRAEDDRKREEIRKQDEVVRITEEETKERKRDKQEEKQQNERNKRESDELQRRRMEEEELRRKQEIQAARRAEVERQRKDEDKRKKEEDKRRKEEEKRKQAEERERLKMEEERKKKEAEEAKKHQDLMNKIQRDQWCPPQASNTSLLDIQRSEREQQVLRSMRDQQAQEAVAAAAAAAEKTNLRLKWTETNRTAPFLVESLADIQAQQYRQFMKVQEKEKAEREKKEAAAAAANQQVGGTWSQGLNWGALPQQPVWHNNQGGAGGFWDQLGGGPKPVPSSNPVGNKVSKASSGGTNPAAAAAAAAQQQQAKENKSKAKREEIAVMQLFGNQARQDDFTKWCQQTLANLPMTCPYDIPTFVSFLREIESGPDVLEYVRGYVGESKEATEFARQFLERRHSLVQSQGQPAPHPQVTNQPLSPHSNEDFQQVKSKGKNKKKGRITKMQTVDPRILGFSSTASPDRINVGDREYPEDL